MKPSVAVGIFKQPVAVLVHLTALFAVFLAAHGKIVPIDEVISGIVGRVNVNHLHLAQIALLQEFQHFQVVALNIEVFGGVPVHALRRTGPQGLANGPVGLHDSGLFAHPGELIGLVALQYHIRQQLPQQVKVDRLFQLAVLALGLGHAGGEQSGKFFDVGLRQVRGFHFQLVHFVLPPC